MVHWTTDVDILKQKFMYSETIQLPSLFNTYPSDNKSVDLICDNLQYGLTHCHSDSQTE